MKRLLFAVALSSALATAAGATRGRVAVVYPSNVPAASGFAEVPDQFFRNLRMLTDALDRGGVDYFLLPGKQVKIEQLRRGVIEHGSTVDSVVGVIHASFFGVGTYISQSQYRGDSLTRIATNSGTSGCDVPQLFLCDNVPLLSAAASYLSDAIGAASARCSTGVVGNKTAPSQGQGIFWYGNKTRRILNTPYTAGWKANSTAPAGGIRYILGGTASGRSIQWFDAAAENRNAFWPDSMPFIESSDTLLVWERLWNVATLPNAKPMVFCDWSGAGASTDSTDLGTNYVAICEGNLQVMLVGLARFDSLCGGIFRRPIQGAVVVQNALSRGLERWKGGIAPHDTAAFYGSLDSLKAWGVPLTFFGNFTRDSATTYARDLIKLKEIGQAHFAPQIWDGVADTTKGCTWVAPATGQRGKPRDVFGKYVDRAVYGDGTAIGSDSSTWAQLKIAKSLRDSIITNDWQRSTTLWPPLDDFSPKLADGTNRTRQADSLMWAMADAGFTTIIVNGRSANLRKDAGLPGSFQVQKRYKPMLGTKSVTILAHNGGMLCGGQYQQFAYDDSTTNFARIGNIEREVARAMAGICLNSYADYDIFQYDDPTGAGAINYAGIRYEYEDRFPTMLPKHGSIVQMSCADLSGSAAAPARSGLHVIKSLWNLQLITQGLAGRPIFQLTYPENVRP